MIVSDKDRAKVKSEFIGPMLETWDAPYALKTKDEQAIRIEKYFEPLARFSYAELSGGYRYLRDTHSGKWPEIPVCVKACREQREKQHRTDPRADAPRPKRSEVMQTPEAQEALREGWGWDYWLLVFEYGPDLTGRPGQPKPKLSPEQMKRQCRAAAQEIDRLIAAVQDDPKMSKLGRHLKTKNEEYRQRFMRQAA